MGLRLQSIEFRDFRNYPRLYLEPADSLTVLVGRNAVGKTNIIEGVQLLTSLTSFRHPTSEQLIRDDEEHAKIKGLVSDGSRHLEVEVILEKGKRRYALNGKRKTADGMRGLLPSVTFTPDDLELVKKGNTPKRALIDNLGIQLNANYGRIKKDYEKLIHQKNALLKEEVVNLGIIEALDEVIINCGSQLFCYRVALFARLEPFIQDCYSKLSAGRETLSIFYTPSWSDQEKCLQDLKALSRDEVRKILSNALSSSRNQELSRKRAVIGPHNDKIRFLVDGKDAALFASQGQQRSIVLAIKMAEVLLVEEILDCKPVLLLDDVMSELDERRRKALVDLIDSGLQTIISTTTLSYFDEGLCERAKIVHLPIDEKENGEAADDAREFEDLNESEDFEEDVENPEEEGNGE